MAVHTFTSMNKFTILLLLLLFSGAAFSQPGILLFKKKNKTLQQFWPGSVIAFQLKNGQWQKGAITRITADSFYIQPSMIRYNLFGNDTLHYAVKGFALSDAAGMPNEGLLIDYKNERLQIAAWGGHVHWYWVKSGWIFRAGAAGYAGLHVVNGIIKNDFSLLKSKGVLITTAGIFAVGLILKRVYKPVLPLGKKYHLETM